MTKKEQASAPERNSSMPSNEGLGFSTASKEDTAAGELEVQLQSTDTSDDLIIPPQQQPTQPAASTAVGPTNLQPVVTEFEDHFTLLIPSSTIRYRDMHSAARVLEGPDSQFVMEEVYDADSKKNKVSIRRIHDTSEGVRLLRVLYAIATAQFLGFLFVFSLQTLLFLFLDLAIQTGATSKQGSNWGKAIGVILAFPGFVYGLSCALVIAGAYILDTWRGHYLIRNFTFRNMKASTVEWVFFFFFLGLPLMVLCLSLLSQTDRFWEITTMVWFASVALFYALFTVNVVFYEMKACWEVTKNKNKEENAGWLDLIRRSVLSRQMHQYSGRLRCCYLAKGSIMDAEYTDSHMSERNKLDATYVEKTSLLGKLTKWDQFKEWGFYEDCEPKTDRIFSIDDCRDVRPFLTSYTWNLEKIFCRPKNSRYIAIIRGPGALTQSQLKSSLACSILGTGMLLFLFFCFLIYLQLGAIFTVFMLAVACLVVKSSLENTLRLFKTKRDLTVGYADLDDKAVDETNEKFDGEAGANLVDNRGSAEESECVYLVEEVYRMTKPTTRFCVTMFVIENLLFFLYPLLALFSAGNYPLGIMFFLFTGVTMFRYYVNAAVVLEETGRMDLVDGRNEKEILQNQRRLNEIVGNITRGRSLGAWMSVLGTLGFVFCALMLGAIGSDIENEVQDTPKTFLEDYEYIQKDSLRYPTCRLTNDLGASPLESMADYALLAGLAYRSDTTADQDLKGYFGTLNATNEVDVVADYRAQYDVSSAVSFKLVTVPVEDGKKFGYVMIRGTTNNWDMLTDAQLWSAAALMQVHRELLPFGILWTPIIDELILAITKIESESIDQVSFYRDTREFALFLKNQTETYAGIAITGHSLGGGLSIISGAQAGLPAVALSGPNAMLSRRSFDPPISVEALDSKTFNIIPARDLVPQIDDKAQNWQEIRCQAEFEDVIGCHNSVRSLCEIMYSCGTQGRPFLCQCVTEFGYPDPTPRDGVDTPFDRDLLCPT